MKRRSTSRNFCVLPLATSLCVFLSDQSLSPLPKVILTAPHLSRQQLFFSPGWVLCFSVSPRDAAKPTLPQLNLHNTRVRRKPSGFLQCRAFLAWRRADSRRSRAET